MEESNIPSFNVGDLIGRTIKSKKYKVKTKITHELVQDLSANNPIIDDDVKKEIEDLILKEIALSKSKNREDKINKLLDK
jgi:hypothetical protein